MALPRIALPRDVVTVCDEKVEVRGLTRAEALHIKTLVDKRDLGTAEAQMVAYTTDTSLGEVQEWMKTVPSGVVDVITDATNRLSNLTEGAQFQQ